MNNHDENVNNVATNNDDGHTNYTEAVNIDEDEGSDSEHANGHEAQHNNVHRVPRMRRERIRYNAARDFHEERGVQDFQLPSPITCPYCTSLLFHRETFSLCCMKGNIELALIQSPPEMVRLFSDQTDESKKFRQNIRAYNNVFAFTSMGVHLDETINVQGRGPYTFRAQGSIYHKIGGLVPADGRRPRYLQAYIYDTEHELQNRLPGSEVLERGGDDISPNGRDFIVQRISGRLQTVKDSVGYYDPMQYPLLLPYGTYGWDINSRGNNGKEMTCCDYYAYMLQVMKILCIEEGVSYNKRSVEDILDDDRPKMSMLTEFFTLNQSEENAMAYLYREIPEHYRWDKDTKKWVKRIRNWKVIGRIYSVSPSEGEKFYLRVLLNHVRGPKSFLDLLTVNGALQPTFKQAAENRGLLENDNSIRMCLAEASAIRMPSALRRLFVTLLVYGVPVGVRALWDEFAHFMVEDYTSSDDIANRNRLLQDLNRILQQFGKNIRDYDLPQLTGELEDNIGMPRCIEDELFIHVPQEDIDAIDRLNNDQMVAFNTIMSVVDGKESALFFVDGPGGTGKTYLYRALLANLRRMNHIVLTTASSGIAANILPGGKTAHSRFKIPLKVLPSSMCSIGKQSALAQLVRQSTAVIWDEAPMTNRDVFELVDRTFQDIMDVELPFGGKIMIFGGDFRQVLPVIPKGTRSQLIEASIMRSSFWPATRILRLRQNMRSINDHRFGEFLLRVGDGSEQVIHDDMIRLPESMVIPWQSDQCIFQIIDRVFPNLGDHVGDARYMVDRALITPLNDDADMLNEKIISMFPGEEISFYSFDSVEDDIRNLYQPEFLNSITASGLPPHRLTLKAGAPIMLLRNIDPKLGFCNGTRLLCRGSYQNLIDAEIMTGEFVGSRVFLPRIPLQSAENAGLPFQLTRKKQKHNDQYSFLVKFNNQRLEKLKRNIENSSDNWSRGTAAIELSEFMFNQRWLTNGWLRWS
ncbi:hypothetical protein ACLB2K_045183 [Fragaria x ananassa]